MKGYEELAIDNFVKSGKRNGWWSKMTAIYVPMWRNQETRATINWITQTADASFTDCIFSNGFAKTSGATEYMDLGFAPDDFALDSLSIGVFLLSQSSSTTQTLLMGASGGSGQETIFQYSYPDTDFEFIHANDVAAGKVETTSNPVGADTKGFFLANRNGTTREIIRQSAGGITVLQQDTGEADSGALDSNNFYLGALNDGGTAVDFTAMSFSLVTLGDGLSEEERNIFCYDCYNLVDALYSGGVSFP